MASLSHSHCLDHLSNIWSAVQFMKLLIMQSSAASCYFPSEAQNITAVGETKSGKNMNVRFGGQNHDDLLI